MEREHGRMKNLNTWIAAALVVLITGSLLGFYAMSVRISALENGQTDNPRNAQVLDNERISCAIRAKNNFETSGFKNDKELAADFTNHYSAKLKRCLIWIRSTNPTPGRSFTFEGLSDVDELRDFGEVQRNFSEANRPDPPIMQCNITPPDAPARRCHSQAEFDDYASAYMKS
jgi:hypothetical protein